MRIPSGMPAFSAIGKREPVLKAGFSYNGTRISSPRFTSGSDNPGSAQYDKRILDRLEFFKNSLIKSASISVMRDEQKLLDGGKKTSFLFQTSASSELQCLVKSTKCDGSMKYSFDRVSFDPTSLLSNGALILEIPVQGSSTAAIEIYELDKQNRLNLVKHSSQNPKVVNDFTEFFTSLVDICEKKCPPSP